MGKGKRAIKEYLSGTDEPIRCDYPKIKKRTGERLEESVMMVCEFCVQYRQNGECRLGLKIPKGMSCREFRPGIEKFCSNPKDFVSPGQIIQMATYFGMKGTELKKIKLMAEGEESARLQVPVVQASGHQ